MMILMANVIFGEKVAAAQWMAAFIGLAGTWLVIRPPFPGTGGWLLLLPLGMGSVLRSITCLLGKCTERTSANLFHTALWVFIALSFVMPSVWHTPSLKAALAMIGIGVWGFVLLLFLDRALAWAPASLVAPFIYTQCIWGDALELIRRRFHPGFARTPRFNSNHGITGMDFRSRMQVQPDFQKPAT
jgi:drug/metabolite transporter (DMT)-like permease